MKKTFARAFYCMVVLYLFGCSIDISQPTTESSTLPPPTSSDLFTMAQTTKIPVTWVSLNLTGKLVYISSGALTGGTRSTAVQVLDLATGEAGTIFRAPEEGWIYYMTISPVARRLVISYIGPSQPDSPPNRALYIMPLDEAESPQLLITPPTSDDHYVQAEWSPDGKYIYYAHYNYNIDQQASLIRCTKFFEWPTLAVSPKRSWIMVFGPEYLQIHPNLCTSH